MIYHPFKKIIKGGDCILTGTVNNGDTVPLPQGCNAEDCITMLAVYDMLNESIAGGNHGMSPLYGFGVSMDEDRKATTYQKYITGGKIHSAVASYLVIGQKSSSNTEIPQVRF